MEGWNEIIKEKFSSAIAYDYFMNGRQYAFYIVDCTVINCREDFRKALTDLANKHTDKINIRFYEGTEGVNQQEYTDKLISTIGNLLQSEI